MQRQIASRMRGRLEAARLALPIVGAALLGTSACATSSYMGISLIPGDAAPEVQALAQRARNGDKQAQLGLGIRFEEGNGVPQDKAHAIKLYRQAAQTSGGTVWIYVPSGVQGKLGRVMHVAKELKVSGLVEARARLKVLEQAE